MKCPICKDTNLVMSERMGVEIDYCPDCRGVWLDRGELDKIVQQSLQRQAMAESVAPQAAPAPYGNDDQRRSKHHGRSSSHGGYSNSHDGYGGRRKSFLERLFD